MDEIKITPDDSLNNFLWDIFIRSFDCRNDLYEDTLILNDNEKAGLLQSHFKNVGIWEKMYDKRLSFIKENVHLVDSNGRVLNAEEIVFHPKAGWTISNGDTRAFLGKVSYNLNVRVNIGNCTYFSGSGVVRGDGLLQIGSYCCVAEGCYISVASDAHPMDYPSLYGFDKNDLRSRFDELPFDLPVKYTKLCDMAKKKAGVTVGNDVWFGRNVRIFHGVNIPNGCVIGESSLVKKDCEPYGIYAGVPAQLIRYRFPERIIKQLQEIQWWDWPFHKISKNLRFFDTDLTSFKGNLSEIIVDD
jgi:acetyltransferase-like isoleucine patch superfamily enzyme